MDKKSIIGLVLIFGIFIGYTMWIDRPPQEQNKNAQTDTIKTQAVATEQPGDTTMQAAAVADSTDSTNTVIVEDNDLTQTKASVFKNLVSTEGEIVTVATDRITVELNTLGAMINKVTLKDYQTYDKQPLVLITPSADNLDLSFGDREHPIQSQYLHFKPYVNGKPWNGEALNVQGGDSAVVALRADISGEIDSTEAAHYLEFAYTFHGDGYEVDFDVRFVGLDDVVVLNDTRLIWKNRMLRQEKHREGTRSERTYTRVYYKPPTDDVDHLAEGKNDSKTLNTKLDWVAFKQQFFCAILTADSHPFENSSFSVFTDTTEKTPEYLTDMQASLDLDMRTSKSMNMGFYFGPTKYRDLKAFDRDFDKMLPLGWTFISKNISRWLIIPAFNFLEKFNWNYGIIIIVFTLLIRLILLPLVFKSYRGGAIMRILKPEMDALNQRFPKKEQAMQKQQAMMALQKSAGYSPMAGCLPVLMQMPFLTAMFFFFPQAFELRQKPFLWSDDLSTYDSVLDFGTSILGHDHLSMFCLLMFGMQFFYTWYTMKQQAGTQSMPGMKFMMYFMPFMMLFIFNSQSAGLNLYYLISLTFTMTTMILIRKFTSEKKVRARMAAYAKNAAGGKPKKKSRFQQRLEELQKQAEQMQKQKEQQQRRR